MDAGSKGVGPGTRSWIGPVGDLKGGLGDAAGAEEGGPVGVVGGFANGVIGPIAEPDTGEPPGAGCGIGIQLATGEGDATEFRAGDDSAVIEVEISCLT